VLIHAQSGEAHEKDLHITIDDGDRRLVSLFGV
jgi:hypothetical protein